jgi:hypothetical protein
MLNETMISLSKTDQVAPTDYKACHLPRLEQRETGGTKGGNAVVYMQQVQHLSKLTW